MPSYFIEMGQGIVADGNDLQIATSQLYSCTFIAGLNEQVGHAGAFHYPAGCLQVRPLFKGGQDARLPRKNKILSKMVDWIRTLRPTRVVLVHGPEDHAWGGPDRLIAEDDFKKVDRFVFGHCPNATISARMESNAAMIIVNGEMHVGSQNDLQSTYSVHLIPQQINLQNQVEGDYKKYILFGRHEKG